MQGLTSSVWVIITRIGMGGIWGILWYTYIYIYVYTYVYIESRNADEMTATENCTCLRLYKVGVRYVLVKLQVAIGYSGYRCMLSMQLLWERLRLYGRGCVCTQEPTPILSTS